MKSTQSLKTVVVFTAFALLISMVQESAAASKYPGQRSQTQTRPPPPRPPPHQPTHQTRQMQRMLKGGSRQRLGGSSGSSG
uniref:Pancreatic trypsin inhibitor n=1 Tax=Rhipicephalus zambeziensis TaxID=60191 RepID=A0A224Y9A1_9ACAR